METLSLCLVAESKNWRCVIGTVNVTMCLFKAADNQQAVAKQTAFSSSWQAAVGWLRTV